MDRPHPNPLPERGNIAGILFQREREHCRNPLPKGEGTLQGNERALTSLPIQLVGDGEGVVVSGPMVSDENFLNDFGGKQ